MAAGDGVQRPRARVDRGGARARQPAAHPRARRPARGAFTYYRAEAFRARRRPRRAPVRGDPRDARLDPDQHRGDDARRPRADPRGRPGDGALVAPLRRAGRGVLLRRGRGDRGRERRPPRRPARPSPSAWDGGAVRFVQLRPDGTQVLRRQGDPAPVGTTGPHAPGAGGAGPRPALLGRPAAPTTLQIQDDRVPGAPVRSVALPGTAVGVWAAGGVTAVAVRAGSRVAVLRVDARRRRGGCGPARRVPARRRRRRLGGARRRPRGVGRPAAGALRRVTTARRQVDAVAVDGRRLAWAERGLRRGTRVARAAPGGDPVRRPRRSSPPSSRRSWSRRPRRRRAGRVPPGRRPRERARRGPHGAPRRPRRDRRAR